MKKSNIPLHYANFKIIKPKSHPTAVRSNVLQTAKLEVLTYFKQISKLKVYDK